MALLLVQSQLVKEGEDFLLKKGISKDYQGFRPYQNKPFRGPHNKKWGSYRKRPYGGNSSQSSNQSVSTGRGKPNFRGSRGHFQPHPRGRGHENPSPNDLKSLPQSTSWRSPPLFQKRLANKQMFIQRVKHYHQWLRSAIHFKAKSGQIPSDSVRIQGPSKRSNAGHLYSVSSVKERNRKGGKCKFYCINTSYPMDNCLSGRRRPARQTPEKDVLCFHRLAGPSTVHSPDGVSYFLPV